MIQDDKVEYIYYMNEKEEKEYWGISPVTNTAHKLQPPSKRDPEYTKQLNHFNKCTQEAHNVKVEFITTYLIKLGYCNFERNGYVYNFTKYFDDSTSTTMITKPCDKCGNEVLLNTEINTCRHCIHGE